MQIHTLETTCLGNRSYVLIDGTSAVVVDPPRDIDRVEEVLDQAGARVDLVLETHRHADYLSGGLELVRRHRAAYVVPPGEPEPRFGFVPAVEGRDFGTGDIGVRVMGTPGHTPHHVAYVLEEGGRPAAVCTGGSLLFGSVGRTDLHGSHRTWTLARDQWRSARRLLDALPPDVQLLPTHGFGSLCSASPGATSAGGTLGEEHATNPALLLAESVFVPALVAGFGPVPRHYARLPLLNAAGPAPIDLSPAPRLSPDELQQRQAEGHWLVDLRDRRDFARNHLRGAVNVEVTGPLVAYLPWILPPGAGVVLLGDDDAIASAARQLTQVGVDRPVGTASGSALDWAGGDESRLASYDVATFADLAKAQDDGAVPLDVRSLQEWQKGHVRGALHLSLPELADIADPSQAAVTAPVGERTWVYCGGGFRAAIAASLLSAARVDVVLIHEPFDAAVQAGLTVTDETRAAYPNEPSQPAARAVPRPTFAPR